MQTQPISNQENPFVSDDEENEKNSKSESILKEKSARNESQNKADPPVLFLQNEDTPIQKQQQFKSEIYEIPKERKSRNPSILEQKNTRASRDLLSVIVNTKQQKTHLENDRNNFYKNHFRKSKSENMPIDRSNSPPNLTTTTDSEIGLHFSKNQRQETEAVEYEINEEDLDSPSHITSMHDDSMPVVNLKVVVIGDSGVGKSSLLYRFVNHGFLENTKATIGIDLLSYETKINGAQVYVQFWDTAGQEKYRGMVSTYYKSCHAVLLVYDITNKNSFLHLDQWLLEVKTYADPDVSLFVIGNKLDLEYERRVSNKEIMGFANKNNLGFLEASAKDESLSLLSEGISKTVERAAKNNTKQFKVKKQAKYQEAQRAAKNLEVPEFGEIFVLENKYDSKKEIKQKYCCV